VVAKAVQMQLLAGTGPSPRSAAGPMQIMRGLGPAVGLREDRIAVARMRSGETVSEQGIYGGLAERYRPGARASLGRVLAVRAN
jgi:hypothetical protein